MPICKRNGNGDPPKAEAGRWNVWDASSACGDRQRHDRKLRLQTTGFVRAYKSQWLNAPSTELETLVCGFQDLCLYRRKKIVGVHDGTFQFDTGKLNLFYFFLLFYVTI